MKLRIFLAVVALLAVFGGLAAVKALQIQSMIDAGAEFVPPPVAVQTAMATEESWPSALSSVGTVSAIDGVTVRAEVSGVVQSHPMVLYGKYAQVIFREYIRSATMPQLIGGGGLQAIEGQAGN